MPLQSPVQTDINGNPIGTSTNPVSAQVTGSFKSTLADSFGSNIRATVADELRVAGLYLLADLTNKYELDTRLWDVLTASAGSVTHVPAESALRVAVVGTSGSSATLRTNTYYKYQAGYTQLIGMSVINSDTGQAGQLRDWGYVDDNNGLFFRLNGTSFNIVERSDATGVVVETVISQSAFSKDPVNGFGASGLNLNVSKGNLYEIEVQWFGVGTTRYFIDDILVHESKHANTLTLPYMRTAKLPVQAKVTNLVSSSAGYLDLICARVAAQAQTVEPAHWVYGVGNTNSVLITQVEAPVLSIRPKSTYNGITNRSIIQPKSLSISTQGYPIAFRIIANPVLTGASFNSSGNTSLVDYDVAATGFTGGEVLYRGVVNSDLGVVTIDMQKFFQVYGRIMRNAGFLGIGVNANDILTVVASNLGAGKTQVKADMTWLEIR